ncbi:MAG: type II toxin-antitoxin system MqsA family antitoxin [Sedimenticola sp.]|nr:MAG: type II toxin-antitoxin system MqsA family antitoxin [Sedimenticola sp.]
MNDSNNLCPICGEGNLHPEVGKNPVEYKGQTTELDLHYSLCDACGSEQADATQTRVNKRLMIAFKKRVDGLLVGAEVRAVREKLGLSQAEAAQAFGGGPVAFSKYESDDVAQSEAMDKLLRLAAELPSAFDLLCRRAGLGRVLAGEQWQQAEGWLAEPRHPAEGRRPRLRVVSSSTPSADQPTRYAA